MDWTDYSEVRFQWKGDHAAAEAWAEDILTRHQGKQPHLAVFMGDCHGVYVDPQRLAELGVPSRYSRPVLVQYDGWIEWNGHEFVVADADDTPANPPSGDAEHCMSPVGNASGSAPEMCALLLDHTGRCRP